MSLDQHAVTPYMDHKILEPTSTSLLFSRIFSDKVGVLETPCHLPETLTRYTANQPIASYDVG